MVDCETITSRVADMEIKLVDDSRMISESKRQVLESERMLSISNNETKAALRRVESTEKELNVVKEKLKVIVLYLLE